MKTGLALMDWAVVGIYFAFIGVLALYVGGKQRSVKDYFLGGRSLPWWAATLSIVATETSAITFIGVPAMSYRGDWGFLQLVLGFVIGRLFLAVYFVKALYRDDTETVYGYLGWRFGEATRSIAALFFLAGRVAGSGVRLLGGCIALGVALEAGGGEVEIKDAVRNAIIALGIFGTIFTLIGGIKAVVWTDVVLGFTLIASGLIAALYLWAQISSAPSAPGDPTFGDKIQMVHFGWSLSDSGTLLAGVIGGFFLTMATHGTDQDIAQRMLTCENSRGGSLSVIGSAVLIVPLFTLFLTVGTLLWFFYRSTPSEYALPNDPNHIFPVFIVRELPTGVAGFVIAGLLAASLSSLTSVLNALAATTVSDLYRPWCRMFGRHTHEDTHLVSVSRWVTLLWGGVLVYVAICFSGGDKNILSLALQVLTYFYGALLGAFLLGILTHRGTGGLVFTGMVAGVAVVLVLQLRQFVDQPGTAPTLIRSWVESLDRDAILSTIPDIAWPYWTLIGAACTFTIGLLRATPFTRRD